MRKKCLLLVETIENELPSAYAELLHFSTHISPGGLEQVLLVIAGEQTMPLAIDLAQTLQVDTLAVEHSDLRLPNPMLLSGLLQDVITCYQPDITAALHTVRSCQLVATLGADLRCATLTGVEAVCRQEKNLVFRKAMFNGKLQATLRSHTEQALITIVAGAFTAPDEGKPKQAPAAKAEKWQTAPSPAACRPMALHQAEAADNRLDEADVIVSAGMGIGKEENLELIRKTAGMFTKAAIGASRIVCDQGWLSYAHQIGETGRRVSPRVYLACGISGTMQHTAGIRGAGCVIAINIDPNAPIFSVADYGVVEDLKTFLPLLLAVHENACPES